VQDKVSWIVILLQVVELKYHEGFLHEVTVSELRHEPAEMLAQGVAWDRYCQNGVAGETGRNKNFTLHLVLTPYHTNTTNSTSM
jgi:hypothetical protein